MTQPQSSTASAWREAARLSWPATLSLLLHAGYRVNDQYWIGPLGADAQAAFGVTSFQLILNFALIVLVQSGTLARIARHTGSGDHKARHQVFQTMVPVGFLWFMAIGALGWFATPKVATMLGASGEVHELAVDYLRMIYLGLPFLALKPFTDGVFLGIGNTFTPMVLAGASVALNFVLNPLLIYGHFGFPELGIGGAAIATCISRGMAGGVGLFLLARHYGFRPLKPMLAWAELKRVLQIGMPVCFSNAAYSLSFIAVLKTSVEPFGRNVQAGIGVAFNGLEAVSYCGYMGPAIACSSLVGRRLGAGDPAGARAAVRACLAMSLAIAAIATLLFLLIPRQLVSLYTDSPEVLTAAAVYLWVAGWTQMLTAADSVLQQALAGAGRTVLMSLTTMSGLALRIPLAWFLAHQLVWGPKGIWWAFNISNCIKLTAIVAVFRYIGLHRSTPLPDVATGTRPDSP